MSDKLILDPSLNAAEWVDLSHTYDSSTQYWPGFRKFKLTETFNGETKDGYWATTYDFEGAEHGGTHMDAPSHIGKGANWTLDQIPVQRLVAHVALVNISERCQADPDTTLTAADLADWKAEHGPFPSPTVLLVQTGNATHWTDTNRYWGFPADYQPDETAEFGTVEAPPMRFPGLGLEAAQLLAEDPAVVGVGLDTPSLDPGYSTGLDAHQALFAANMFGLEHVGDMSRVPPTGATLVALPMKIGGGSGGPCRVLVRLPTQPRPAHST